MVAVAAITINVFVKNPESKEKGQIYYHDIGDYLTREEKLSRIRELGSVARTQWTKLKPDQYNDWINQKNPEFDKFPAIGEKRNAKGTEIFTLYSRGLATGRDAWCYNASKSTLIENVEKSISFFNSEVQRYQQSGYEGPVNDFVDLDSRKFSWDRQQRKWVEQGKEISFIESRVYVSTYRPFVKQHVYFDRSYNNMVYLLPSIFSELRKSESSNLRKWGRRDQAIDPNG